MSNSLDKYNKKRSPFTYQIPEGDEFRKLKELYDKKDPEAVLPVYYLAINRKSKYGPSPFAASDGCLISLPYHLADTVQDMIDDQEIVDMVNAGELGLKIVTYKKKDSRQLNYSVEWVKIDSGELPY